MVTVKSEYVMSVLYKDSKKIDSEGNVNWSNREDYLKEENEKLERENNNLKQLVSEYKDYAESHVVNYLELRALEHENEQLKKEEKVNRTKASLLTEIEIIKEENQKLKEELLQSDYVKASIFSDREEYKKQIVKLHEELKTMKLQNEKLKRKDS